MQLFYASAGMKKSKHCIVLVNRLYISIYFYCNLQLFFPKINHMMKLDGVVICAFILEVGMVILLKIRTARIRGVLEH
jgi:hypothetical protein